MLQQAAIAVDADADVHMPVATLAAGGLREDLEPPQPRQDPRRVGWVVASRTWRGGRYRRRGWRRCRAAADGAGRLGRRPTNRARARNLGRWQVHDRQHRQCGWRRWGRRRGRVRLHRRQRCDRRRVGLLLDVQGGVWRDWLVRGCLVPGWLRGRLGRRGGGLVLLRPDLRGGGRGRIGGRRHGRLRRLVGRILDQVDHDGRRGSVQVGGPERGGQHEQREGKCVHHGRRHPSGQTAVAANPSALG